MLNLVHKVLVRPATELQPVAGCEFELSQPEGVALVPVAHLAAKAHLEEVGVGGLGLGLGFGFGG